MRPSLLTWLCTSLSAGLPRWSRLLSYHSRASGTSGTGSSAVYPLELFTLSFSQARRLEICNLKTGDCASVCSRSGTNKIWTLGVTIWSSVLLMARVLQLHNGVLCNLDLFRKLRYVEEFPGCRHLIGDVSRVELEMQIRLVFSLKSHAPRVTERQCQGCFIILLVTGLIQIRSFTILLEN